MNTYGIRIPIPHLNDPTSQATSKSRRSTTPAPRYRRLKPRLDQNIFQAPYWRNVDTTVVHQTPSAYTSVDLFAGAGGSSQGARSAGFNKLFSIEVDPDASQTIRDNFPSSIHLETSIQAVSSEMLDQSTNGHRVNLLFAGPPCQGFSVAGLRNPADPRNQLFTECVRITKHLQPDFIVMENVPGILSMEAGQVSDEIHRQFADIGYPNMTVRILESAAYGVPQFRPRAIFIANRHGVHNPYPAELLTPEQYVDISHAIDDIKDHPRDSIPNHQWTRHSAAIEARIAQLQPGDSLYTSFQDAFKRQRATEPSMTVKENHGGCHIHYSLNRVLSAREMARLQTFPDDYKFAGRFKRVYWQVGNAIPCILAKHISLAIRTQLEALNTMGKLNASPAVAA